MDKVDDIHMLIEVTGITCELDFDDPEDATWLSASSLTRSIDVASLTVDDPLSMLGYSSTVSSDTALLTSPTISIILLAYVENKVIYTDTIYTAFALQAPAATPALDPELVYSWINMSSVGFNPKTWDQMSSYGEDPTTWDDLTS